MSIDSAFIFLIIIIAISILNELIYIGRNGHKDGPKGRTWEEKRIGLIYKKGQVFIYLQ
jgi:hypothetical protein